MQAAIFTFVAGLAIGISIGLGIAAARRRSAERDHLMGVRRRDASVGAATRMAPSDAPAPAGDIDEDIRMLAARGKKIEAIKQLRQRTGIGLKEAKEAIERLD